jgi:predicted alpha/beta-fold hydrolase
MRGMTTKAYRAGFNVIRMNQRTCGGSDHLTPTLYNSGLSNDYRAIIQELRGTRSPVSDMACRIFDGGNLVLKAAGEMAGRIRHWQAW